MAACANYISLCSGVGGLDLGLRRALPEARCVCYVENEVTAAAVLAARMQDKSLDEAPIWSDVRTFDAAAWRGLVDGVIGGYPCQPFSAAGKRRGTDDPRHLWPHVYRVLCDSGAQWGFFENVAGHLALGYHDVVKPDFVRAGLRVAEGIFTAAEAGAPHRRERLFILAVRDCSRWPQAGQRQVKHTGEEPETGSGNLADAYGELGDIQQRTTWAEPDRESAAVGDAGSRRRWAKGHKSQSSSRFDRSSLGILGDTDRSRPQGRRIPQREGSDEWLAWPPGPTDADAWARILAIKPDLAPATESEIRGVVNGPARGLARADKLRLLGNAVVPAQAALAFRTLWSRLSNA